MSGNESKITSGNQQTLEQSNVKKTVAVNEANVGSAFDAGDTSSNGADFSKYPQTLDEGKQGKHVLGHNNYQPGKSRLIVPMAEAANLVRLYSGKGTPIGDNKERVDFGITIGIYMDPITGIGTSTTVGIIHYSKNGTHIVPARPKGE